MKDGASGHIVRASKAVRGIFFVILLLCVVLLCGCGAGKMRGDGASDGGMEEPVFTESMAGRAGMTEAGGEKAGTGEDDSAEEKGRSDEEKQAEKGYDLPISDAEREEAERDCAAKMGLARDLFPECGEEDSSARVSDRQIQRAVERIGEEGSCVISSGLYADMENHERFEAFLERAASGEECEEILYKITGSGMLNRQKYIFDGEEMYVITATVPAECRDEAALTYLAHTRIDEWRYTRKGWFCYRLCVPGYPEVTEVVDGSCMVRVRPMSEENREMSEKCVLGVAYKGNNLFCCDWDAAHMEKLDYNGLYEYLYGMKYGENFPAEDCQGGIPGEAFEGLMTEYLPVSKEDLRKYAVYDAEKHVYAWEMQEYSNDAPVFFSEAVPEVTDIRENEDGTVTLTVDAVCEMLLCDDAAITHEVTVRFREDGSFQYLGNRIIHSGADMESEYRYRIRERQMRGGEISAGGCSIYCCVKRDMIESGFIDRKHIFRYADID